MRRPLTQAGRRCRLAVQGCLRAVVDFVYPFGCPLCGREESLRQSSVVSVPVLCAECRAELAPPIENPCARCGAPAGPHLDTAHGCARCRNDRFAFERAISVGVYEEGLQIISRRIKQSGSEPLAAALGNLLGERLPEPFRPPHVDCVVPVPEHWFRRLRRPQNPSATLAAGVARSLKVPVRSSILTKVRRTPLQVSLTPTQRRTNLRGAFRAWGSQPLSGQSVLLVDDILTTGTTAHEASKVLRGAGAQRVRVAVLARGLGASRRVAAERATSPPSTTRTSRP